MTIHRCIAVAFVLLPLVVGAVGHAGSWASPAVDYPYARSSASVGNAIRIVDSIGALGQHTSIAIGSDGLPIVSYYDSTNRRPEDGALCGDVDRAHRDDPDR